MPLTTYNDGGVDVRVETDSITARLFEKAWVGQLTKGGEESSKLGVTLLRWTRTSVTPLAYDIRIEIDFGASLHRVSVEYDGAGIPTFVWNQGAPDDILVEHYIILQQRLRDQGNLMRDFGVSLFRARAVVP